METLNDKPVSKPRRKRRVRLEREYERKETPWDTLEEPAGWQYVLEQILIFSGAIGFLIGFWYVISVVVMKLLQKGGGAQ